VIPFLTLPPGAEQSVIFDGKDSPRWESLGVGGGDFAKFASYQKGLLAVDVPAGNSWGKAGILSSEPVLQVEPYSEVAPYRFTIHADPEHTSGFVFALSPEHVQDLWPSHVVWIGLIRGEDGRYVLDLHYSPYQDWMRTVAVPWNGDLVVTLENGRVSAAIPGGPTVSGPVPIATYGKYYLGIFSHPNKAGAASSLALKSIIRERIVPADLPAEQIWDFLTPDQFDASTFMGEIHGDLVSGVLADAPEPGVSPR
jgi:hypothetical protein